jgi:hypothetical protein
MLEKLGVKGRDFSWANFDFCTFFMRLDVPDRTSYWWGILGYVARKVAKAQRCL